MTGTNFVLEKVHTSLRGENYFEPQPQNGILVPLSFFQTFRQSPPVTFFWGPPPPPPPRILTYLNNCSYFVIEVLFSFAIQYSYPVNGFQFTNPVDLLGTVHSNTQYSDQSFHPQD